MHREKILDTARKLVAEDRNKQYGEPEVNLKLAGILKHVFWKHATRDISPAEHEAIDMVLTKLSRIGTGQFKEDNYIDAAGYIAIAGQMGARHNIIAGPVLGPSKLENAPTPVPLPMSFGRHTFFCPAAAREGDMQKLMEHHKKKLYNNVSWDEMSRKEFSLILDAATMDLHRPIDDKHPLRRHAVRMSPQVAETSQVLQNFVKTMREEDRS